MEKLGRGSLVIQEACNQAGLPPLKWHSDNTSGVTLTLFAPEVTPEVCKLLMTIEGQQSRLELQKSLALKDAEHFRKHYLIPAIDTLLIAMTIPEKPNSRLQKYRLTSLGQQVKQQLSDSNL